MAWKKRDAGDGKTVRYTTLKVRLYPSEAQAQLFENTFGCCRWLWNRMLADEKRFYLETDQHFLPTPAKYKREAPFLREVDNQALIQEHNKLAQAFRMFFKSPETFGYPNFKRKKDGKESFTACNHVLESGPTIYTTGDGIRMTKAGVVKAKFSRRPQAWWKLRRITVEKTRTGKFFCSIVYEYTEAAPVAAAPTPDTTLGLKYSLAHFYVADNGELADPPRWLRQSQDKLAKLQARISRMEPGSRNYQDAVRKFRLLHEHIANQRRDFLHKQSSRIANGWNAVCVRDDDLRQMAQAIRPGVLDAGFGRFRECLRYKLERQGKPLLLVGRYQPTTRTCSACGFVGDALPADAKTWVCPKCGAVLNREVNAARNIKLEGLAQLCA